MRWRMHRIALLAGAAAAGLSALAGAGSVPDEDPAAILDSLDQEIEPIAGGPTSPARSGQSFLETSSQSGLETGCPPGAPCNCNCHCNKGRLDQIGVFWSISV